jgi:Enoyl-CoA hydratase/carnithine racemase
MTDQIKVDKADGILTLILARPDKKNALSDAMYKALADELEASEQDAAVRAIVIRAEGDMFTAGNDLGEFAAANAGGSGPRNVGRFIKAISVASKPIVAAVQGRAVGVGTTMLLHCDQVVLAEDAQLHPPVRRPGPRTRSQFELAASCPHRPRACVLDVCSWRGGFRARRRRMGHRQQGRCAQRARRNSFGDRQASREAADRISDRHQEADAER